MLEYQRSRKLIYETYFRDKCQCVGETRFICSRGRRMCVHQTFGYIYPELLPFWKDSIDPFRVTPGTGNTILFECRNCASLSKIRPDNFACTVGCNRCNGTGHKGGILFKRSVAADEFLSTFWSPKNSLDPRTISAKSSKMVCLWVCPNQHERLLPPNEMKELGKCVVCSDAYFRNFTINKYANLCFAKWGNKFEYIWSTFHQASIPMKIICKDHGAFYRTINSHVKGQECPKCIKGGRLTTELLEFRFREVWGNTYSYSFTNFIGWASEITVICQQHGAFIRDIYSIIKGRGCSKCWGTITDSSGVKIIKQFLELNHIEYRCEVKFPDLIGDLCIKSRYLRYDIGFMIGTELVLIEYDGCQHFYPYQHWGGINKLAKGLHYDFLKDEYATRKFYSLVRIPYRLGVLQICNILINCISIIRNGHKFYASYHHLMKNVITPHHIRGVYDIRKSETSVIEKIFQIQEQQDDEYSPANDVE